MPRPAYMGHGFWKAFLRTPMAINGDMWHRLTLSRDVHLLITLRGTSTIAFNKKTGGRIGVELIRSAYGRHRIFDQGLQHRDPLLIVSKSILLSLDGVFDMNDREDMRADIVPRNKFLELPQLNCIAQPYSQHWSNTELEGDSGSFYA